MALESRTGPVTSFADCEQTIMLANEVYIVQGFMTVYLDLFALG